MANYFQDPSQSFVPTPVYRPPFEAIQSTLNSRQEKYDRGLSNVRSAYNSVFNAPLTKGENSEVRAQYLKDAEKQLQNLSQVDLSIESNQLEARNVFGNFFKDNDLVQDMVYTKSQANEISKFQSFKVDKADKDNFEYADARSLQDMQNGMEKVRSSKRGDMSVYGVREFTPFTDLTKYTGKMVVDQKIAIEKVNSDGTISYKKTNGPESLGSWTTIMSSMTQDRFNKQFQVEARVAKEEGIKRSKEYIKNTTGTDATDEQALGVYIKEVYGRNYSSFGKIKDDFGEKVTKITTAMNQYAKENPDGSVEELNRFNTALTAAKKGQSDAKSSQDMYDSKGKDYAQRVKDFTDSPDAALYNDIRNKSIYNLATFYAANEQQSIPVEDPRYKMATEANQQLFENNNATRKALNDDRAATDKHLEDEAKLNGTWNYPGGADGSGSGTGTGRGGKKLTDAQQQQFQDDQLTYTGLHATDYKDVPPEVRFATEQSQRLNMALDTFLDPDATAGILTDISGGTISYDDVVTYTSALKSGKSYTNFNAEEKAAEGKVSKLLKEKGIRLDNNNANGLARGLHTLAGSYFNEIKGSTKWNERMIKIWNDDMIAGDNITKYNNFNKLKSDAVVSKLSNSSYKNLIIDRGNGRKDIINSGDLNNDLKGLSANAKQQLGDYAKDYLNGDVELVTGSYGTDSGAYSNSGNIFLKRKGKETIKIGFPGDVDILNNLTKKWGNSKNMGKALTEANNLTISTLPGYNKADAQMGQEFSYHFNATPSDNDTAMQVIKEATLPSNFDVAKGSSGDQEDIDALIGKIHTWGAKQVAEYMNPPIYHTGNGTPTIVLSFKPLSEAQKKEIGDVPDKIELPLNQQSTSAHLQPLLHAGAGMYTYSELSEGRTIKSSMLENGLNFQYEMVPNNRYNPEKVTVTIRTKQLNDKNELEQMNPEPFVLYFKDLTPDQMKAKVNEAIAFHLRKNVNTQVKNDAAAKITTDVQKTSRSAFQKRLEEINSENK